MSRRLTQWLLAACTGGFVFFLESCDQEVRVTVINSLYDAALGLSLDLLDLGFERFNDDADAAGSAMRTLLENVEVLWA